MARTLNSPMSYPEGLSELWMGDRRHGLDELRDYYLSHVERLGIIEPGAAWFTDKMPLNETHLGLIALLFPRAPLIHVVRHPLDIMLSVFSNNLTHGFQCAFSLETAALHYRRVMELVEHYRSALTLRYLPIRYEDTRRARARAAAGGCHHGTAESGRRVCTAARPCRRVRGRGTSRRSRDPAQSPAGGEFGPTACVAPARHRLVSQGADGRGAQAHRARHRADAGRGAVSSQSVRDVPQGAPLRRRAAGGAARDRARADGPARAA
jgi:hypothetical protein